MRPRRATDEWTDVLGMQLGNYRIDAKLGEGGMGVVYRGRHDQLERRVAVKVLRPEPSRNADMLRRFFNEAQAATAIRNPGIVQVFDFGATDDGRAYFVMELLEGQSLSARLKQRRLEAEECCRIGRQIANVLQSAHEAGITHRDLKPDNLFLVPDAEVAGGERVKVLDFGAAKLASELYAAGVRTRTDLVMGTPSYMSPEQCRSAGTADNRSDIYSLGCVLFKMACGRPPFAGAGLGDIIAAHLHAPPPHLQRLAPHLPHELSALITKMLSKHPDARPQTMAEVTRTLDEILRMLGPRPPAPQDLAKPPPAGGPATAPVVATLSPDSVVSTGSDATLHDPTILETTRLQGYPSMPSFTLDSTTPFAHSRPYGPPMLPQHSPGAPPYGAPTRTPGSPPRGLPFLIACLAVVGVVVVISIVAAAGNSDVSAPPTSMEGSSTGSGFQPP